METGCHIVTVIQARMGSTRLPGKVLRPVLGKPLLFRVVERVMAAALAGTVVVATSTEAADDVIADLCQAEEVLCYRGHPTDLLDRHYRAARRLGADAVVKIPSDCPLVDPDVIDRVLGFFLRSAGAYDYVSNLHPASYPDGNDVEVMPFEALEIAWTEAQRGFEREHTTPYLWENPERFRLANVTWEAGQDLSMTHRWTIDYEEDYAFVRAVYEALYPRNPLFGLGDVLALVQEQPDLAGVNTRYAGVNWYRHHLGELKTVQATQTRKEPSAVGHG